MALCAFFPPSNEKKKSYIQVHFLLFRMCVYVCVFVYVCVLDDKVL